MGLVKGILLSMVVASQFASAQANVTDTLVPITPVGGQVLFQSALNEIKAEIAKSQHLTEMQRIQVGQQLELDAEASREELGDLLAEIAKLSGQTYLGGLIVTYSASTGLPVIRVPNATIGGAVEGGYAIYFRNNSFVEESIRGTWVTVVSGALGAGGRTPGQAARDTDGKFTFKALLVTGGQERAAATLKDLEGQYAGAGAATNILNTGINIEGYTKVLGEGMSLDLGRTLLVSLSRNSGAGQASPRVQGKVMNLYFPENNDGQGNKLIGN